MSEYKNAEPIKLSDMFSKNEEERRAMELWNAITTAIYVSGHRGEDVTFLGIETLKKLGRYDLLPPCEKKGKVNGILGSDTAGQI